MTGIRRSYCLPRLAALCGAAISTLALFSGCGDSDGGGAKEVQVSRTEQPIVFVSIPPQRTFVRQIAGERAEVHVMVEPGRSPATYEPSPKQMAALGSAHLYLRIGVPFEDAWMERIRRNAPRMRVVDTLEGIHLRTMEAHHHDHHEDEDAHEHDHAEAEADSGRKDPHVWLDPDLVKAQARTIAEALKAVDPYNAHQYENNLSKFLQRLDDLDAYIEQRLANLEDRTFMVFHPSWGYFAAAYDLEQFAVEVEGKEPGGKALAEIIDRARAEGIDTIFVQPQFSRAAAKTIADAVGAAVATLDPLAEDYFENLRNVADTLARSQQK
mgnify:CR=1 FL=1